MRRVIQVLAGVVAVGAIATWLVTGANRGWTKTSEPKKTLDEITGIEGITYEKKFRPGVDLLGLAMLGAGALAVASLFTSRKYKQKNKTAEL